MLFDSCHRHITYLRLSVTDRCNLRCRYCMPELGIAKFRHEDILTYEELIQIVKAAAGQGMTKVRLTGGEPLVRKGILDFISDLSCIPGILNLRLTTNGVLLADMANDLAAKGIKQINISLDSLSRDTYARLTGRDEYNRVWAGLNLVRSMNFERIKINMVPIRGYNDHEVVDFAKLTLTWPVEIRFIEFMPLGEGRFWSADKVIPTREIKNRLEILGKLRPEPINLTDGPARVFRLPGATGRIGFISPLTDHFCGSCNRLRLTADGKLRLCLLSDLEIDLRSLVRQGASQEEIGQVLRQAVLSKPKSHPLSQEKQITAQRTMNTIGG